MPPRAGSRYTFSLGVTNDAGRAALTDREPFRFRALPDTREHVVVQGDTLWHLAGRYFAPLPRACGFWWVIADFNEVVDPTLALEVGARLFIPSVRVLTDVILARPAPEGA